MPATQPDLELRIRRLERQVARWRLGGAAAALLGGALAWQACSKEQKLPERIELSDGGSTLTLAPTGIELARGESQVSISPDKLSLAGPVHDGVSKVAPGGVDLQPGLLVVHRQGGSTGLAFDRLAITDATGAAELHSDRFQLKRGELSLRASLNDEHGANLRLAHEKARNYALLHADSHGTVHISAHTLVPGDLGPGNGASLFASVTEAAASVSRGKTEKSLTLE